MDIQIDALLHTLENNHLINSLQECLFTDELKPLYNIIKELYRKDGFFSAKTVEQEITGKSLYKYKALLNKTITHSFDECLLILAKEYNKSLYRSLFCDKGNYSIDDTEMFEKANTFLTNFYRPSSFDLAKCFDETIKYLSNYEANNFKIGVEGIDKSLDFQPDRFIVIGGASGSGKTALVTFLVDRICSIYYDKVNVLVVSLEMSEKRLLARLISLALSEPLKSVISRINQSSFDDILDVRAKITKYPLQIIYTSLDINRLQVILQNHINESKRKNLVPIVFIDHFGEIAGLDELTAKSNVDKITATCKDFARQKGICFGLTQLRKDLLDKKNKDNYFKPNNSYIMNSQSVESRADIILHCWRPEHHNIKEIVYEEGDNIIEIDTTQAICLINDKNRDNNKGDIWLNCRIEYNYFEDIDKSKIRIIPKSF